MGVLVPAVRGRLQIRVILVIRGRPARLLSRAGTPGAGPQIVHREGSGQTCQNVCYRPHDHAFACGRAVPCVMCDTPLVVPPSRAYIGTLRACASAATAAAPRRIAGVVASVPLLVFVSPTPHLPCLPARALCSPLVGGQSCNGGGHPRWFLSPGRICGNACPPLTLCCKVAKRGAQD